MRGGRFFEIKMLNSKVYDLLYTGAGIVKKEQ
jgi:hypothetical protein